MKTRQIFSKIHAEMRILFLFLIVLLSGCTKDSFIDSTKGNGQNDEDLHHQVEHFDYGKRNISFSEFKTKLSSYDQKKGINGRSPDDLSFILESNFVVAIDTTRVVEFEGDGITTYTFNIETINENRESFTNLIYIENGDEFSYGLVRYTPSETWLNGIRRGEDIAFDGEINLIDTCGNVLDNDAAIGKTSLGSDERGAIPCIFSVEPIIQACYGSSCPCTDGNGIIIGWNFTISCPNWQGGGSGSSGGTTGGGNGGGSGGGNGNGMNLPTDPTAWAIMVNMNNLIGPNDFFYFDPDIDSSNALIFNSFQDFADDYNGFGLSNVTVIEEQDESITTHYSFDTGLSNVNVYVNQTLKNPTANENYLVHSIVTSLSGFTLGRAWQVDQTAFDIDENNNIATFHIYGNLSQDLFIEDFGIYYQRFIHLVLDINILTGQSMGVAILED